MTAHPAALHQHTLPVARTILSLCDYTGQWSAPYRERGYDVVQMDLKRGHDVRLLPYRRGGVHGILMAPPCTTFAGSGARWWEEKGEDDLLAGLALVDACLRAVAVYEPKWWALENPVGRLSRYLGPAAWSFDPHEFAGWSDDPDAEAYTKRTLLWGRFNEPEKRPEPPVLGSRMHLLPPSPDRAALRSVTPQGFARAFCEANP